MQKEALLPSGAGNSRARPSGGASSSRRATTGSGSTPTATVAHLHSSRFGKLLFGRGRSRLSRFRRGWSSPSAQREMRVRLSPGYHRLLVGGAGAGPGVAPHPALREGARTATCGSARYTNRSEAGLRLRVLTLHDPTTLNFRLDRDPPADDRRERLQPGRPRRDGRRRGHDGGPRDRLLASPHRHLPDKEQAEGDRPPRLGGAPREHRGHVGAIHDREPARRRPSSGGSLRGRPSRRSTTAPRWRSLLSEFKSRDRRAGEARRDPAGLRSSGARAPR